MHIDAACDKCVASATAGSTCCGKGGSWEGLCGRIGEPNLEHTWVEGIKVCKNVKPRKPRFPKDERNPAVALGKLVRMWK